MAAKRQFRIQVDAQELAAGVSVLGDGMWVEPTVMPGLVSSLVRDGVRRRALVFAGARGIPFASHLAVR